MCCCYNEYKRNQALLGKSRKTSRRKRQWKSNLKEKNALTRWKEVQRSQKREPEECSFRQTFMFEGTVARGSKMYLGKLKTCKSLF